MCRHLAYLGPPATLREVLCDPPHGLYRQAWAPRRQRYGTVNADGFGVGWYAEGDPQPARYRQAVPIWADPSFADVARVTRTRALVAAVRSATAGTAPDASAAAPYRHDGYLFSHNGAVQGWPASIADLAADLPPALLLDLESRTDSALLWALVRDRLAAGDPPADALAVTVSRAAARTGGRYNLLLSDGACIAATAYGDTLCYRVADDAVVVASEASDDGPGWVDVPDRHVLLARPGHVSVHPVPDTGHSGRLTAARTPRAQLAAPSPDDSGRLTAARTPRAQLAAPSPDDSGRLTAARTPRAQLAAPSPDDSGRLTAARTPRAQLAADPAPEET